eukprot:jgi/Mesen1/6847/ME000351S05962
MPPKKAAPAKGDLAKKQKLVEDKTFGLKNKNKSKTVQKYVQSLHHTVEAQHKKSGADDVKNALKKKKEEEAAREKELNEIFKVAISQPKVPIGVDPKSIVCEYFRRGQCTKGFKCKFSHDLNVERKGEKIDLYSDRRDGEEDTMEDWDQDKLEQAVLEKEKEYKNSNKPTDIVCKFFLEAIEKKQYGWFWSCPNGGKDCMYRHGLPPGYVLKSQMKALLEEESANRLSIEEQIEQERHTIKTNTQITPAVFAEWKAKKEEQKEAERAAKRMDRAKQDRMSGRELFATDASLFVDDEEAYDEYEREDSEGEDEQRAEASATAGDRKDKSAAGGGGAQSGGGTRENGAGPSASSAALANLTEEDERLLAEDDDELDFDELDELEAAVSKGKEGAT